MCFRGATRSWEGEGLFDGKLWNGILRRIRSGKKLGFGGGRLPGQDDYGRQGRSKRGQAATQTERFAQKIQPVKPFGGALGANPGEKRGGGATKNHLTSLSRRNGMRAKTREPREVARF